jgi:hypothetical protein
VSGSRGASGARGARGTSGAGGIRGIHVAAAASTIVLAVVLLAMFRSLGALAIDDAWITFRYAAQFAAGHGLVFNPGEPVQGYTTPLYALLLGGAGALGADVPTTATFLGFLGALTTGLAMILGRRDVAGTIAGGLLALALVVTPEFLLNSLSGMETSLFCGLLAMSFVAMRAQRWKTLGVLFGLLVLTRPDGAFWTIPAGAWLLVRHRAALLRVVPLAAAPVLAWAVFAWVTYGDPVPHSIRAKRVIHAGSFGDILEKSVNYLAADPAIALLALLAAGSFVVGAMGAERDRAGASGLVLPGFGAIACLMGLGASGVLPFEMPRYFLWYAVPVLPALAYLAVDGTAVIARYARRGAGPIRIAAAGLPLVLATLAHAQMRRDELPGIREHFVQREEVYAVTAAEIDRRAGERSVDVLVGEVGVLGYHLLRHRVHDSSGINSPEILRLRIADRDALLARGETRPLWLREGTPRWVLRFLDREQPEFVTALRGYVHMQALEKDAGFRAAYRPVAEEMVGRGEGLLRNTLWERITPEATP